MLDRDAVEELLDCEFEDLELDIPEGIDKELLSLKSRSMSPSENKGRALNKKREANVTISVLFIASSLRRLKQSKMLKNFQS